MIYISHFLVIRALSGLPSQVSSSVVSKDAGFRNLHCFADEFHQIPVRVTDYLPGAIFIAFFSTQAKDVDY